jgi:hypothetical protein
MTQIRSEEQTRERATTRRRTVGETKEGSGGPERPLATFARGVIEDAGSFVREKVSSLEEHLAERAKHMAVTAALLAGGGLLCMAGLGAATAGLAARADCRHRAWVVASAYTAVGAGLVVAGRIRSKGRGSSTLSAPS